MELQNELDVMIESSSRPMLLPYMIDSVRKNMFYHGKMNWYINEDFVYPAESKKVVKYCHSLEIFKKIYENNPPIGIGQAIQNMLNNDIKSEFYLNLQDDWEQFIPINLSRVLWVMKRNPHINLIAFNKRINPVSVSGYKYLEEEYDGLRMCLSYQVPLYSAIIRTEWMKKHWTINPDQHRTQESHFNRVLDAGLTKSHEHLREIGSYNYGAIGFPAVFSHSGYSWATKEVGEHPRRRSKNGELAYGGNVLHDLKPDSDVDYPPWLPPKPERPMFLDNKQEDIKRLKAEGKIL
jgi:hypothetical protein